MATYVTGSQALSTFPNHAGEIIHATIGDGYEEEPVAGLQYCKVSDEPLTDFFYRSLSYTKLGNVPEHNEADDVEFRTVSERNNKSENYKEFWLGVQGTQRTREVSKGFSLLQRASAELGRSMANRIRTETSNILNRAGTSGYVGGDGLVLLSASHTATVGAVQSNIVQSNANFSFYALEQAIIQMRNQKGDDADPSPATPDTLVVSNANLALALKALESEKTPGDSTNASNVFTTKWGIKVVPEVSMTDTKDWFLLGKNHDLKLLFQVRPYVIPMAEDGRNGTVYFSYRCVMVTHWNEWRDVYGSLGT